MLSQTSHRTDAVRASGYFSSPLMRFLVASGPPERAPSPAPGQVGLTREAWPSTIGAMKLLDVNHPFFLPRWRRIAVVFFCAAWAAFEWAMHSTFWAILATGLAAYSYYALVATFDPERAARKDPEP